MTDSESHQGPPPERQTGAQLHDPPASGKGTDDSSNKEQTNQAALDSLTSNPEGDYNKAVNDKFSKTQKPSEGSN
ncbi:hypothetical protein BR93DRAFT_931092 [Coniochaeta sp. PMI_546]|nr:hypothetical protein BR93DRAFT_931092 [Coniochaeta sp. PMI_546]